MQWQRRWSIWAIFAIASGLKRDEIQPTVGFSMLPPAYRGNVEQVEVLARKEETAVTALQSQQQALEALALQQKSQSVAQQEFHSQLSEVEAKERKLEGLVQRQSEELREAQAEKKKAEVMLQEQSEALLRARSWQIALSRAIEFGNDILRDQLVGAMLYFLIMMIMAKVYGMAFTYPYPKLHTTPVVTREHFTFGLCECCNWDPEAPSREIMRDRRIPCCSCLCQPIRWADTASSSKTGFMSFWTAALLAVVMNALCSVSFFISAGIFIIVATIHRQQIRRIYGMPHGTCPSFTEDLCTWLWCSCCATMQEAMEIEYIDPPAKPWQQTMMESFIPSALQTHPSTPTGTGNRQERTACC